MKITLSVPPLLNRLYKVSGGKFYKSAEATRYKYECMAICISNKVIPTNKELELNIKWYRKALRGDIDGILKALLDSLEGFIYYKDSQVMKITIEKLHDKKNPRIELEYFLYEKLDR